MERDIDMGQTIEDAAKEYSSQFLWGKMIKSPPLYARMI